jgi:uncharacterized protein YgbK (DUF1537 family)
VTLLILADDLTGAADCAARCRQAGLPAEIALSPPHAPLPPGAVAFTSDTRHLPADLAARRVGEVARSLARIEGTTWYKKIDSTLRGNLGSELDALLDTLGRAHAVVCPAFPAQGRGLQEGLLVAASTPSASVHLPTLLAQQSRRSIAAIGLAEVRGGAQRLAERMSMQARRAALLVVDALAEDDLRMIVEAAEQAIPRALLCGSAGLIGALAARYAAVHSLPIAPLSRIEPPGGPALLVVGSGSAMAHRQIAYMRRDQGIAVVEVGEDRLPAPGDRLPTDLLLHLPEPAPDAELDGPEARARAAMLAGAALALIVQLRPALLGLAGGDTAIGVLGRLGIERLVVLRELLPGMPLTQATDAAGRSFFVVLKAGNHGDECTLAALLRLARER